MTEINIEEKGIQVVVPELSLVHGEDNKALCAEVFKMFEHVPQGMTQYQIKNFVLCDREFPTVAGKYWQCMLELWVRLQNVVGLHYDYRKRAARIKELKALKEEALDKSVMGKSYVRERWEAVAERHQVEIEENEFAMMCIVKGVSDKLKEMEAFNDALNRFKSVADSHGELIFLDDKEATEDEFWKAKAEWTPELKARFPEVFGVKSRQEYDKIVRKTKSKNVH